MTTTIKETVRSEGRGVLAHPHADGMLKMDVLGRVRLSGSQREEILNAFERSGMAGQAFALQHGIKVQTFASWMQKRRRARGDYQNESICRKLRMRKDESPTHFRKKSGPQVALNFIVRNRAVRSGATRRRSGEDTPREPAAPSSNLNR
jgi:hypothetical protein